MQSWYDPQTDLLPNHRAALHNKTYVFNRCDVFQRIAGDGDYVSVITRLQLTNLGGATPWACCAPTRHALVRPTSPPLTGPCSIPPSGRHATLTCAPSRRPRATPSSKARCAPSRRNSPRLIDAFAQSSTTVFPRSMKNCTLWNCDSTKSNVKSDSSHAGPRNDRCKEAIHDPPDARHRGRHARRSEERPVE